MQDAIVIAAIGLVVGWWAAHEICAILLRDRPLGQPRCDAAPFTSASTPEDGIDIVLRVARRLQNAGHTVSDMDVPFLAEATGQPLEVIFAALDELARQDA